MNDEKILNLYRGLEQSQWWPEERIQAYQTRKLRSILGIASAKVPYYSERITPASVDQFTFDEIGSLPILTRFDIQEAGTDLHNTTFGPHDAQPVVTSGSTGAAVMILGTEITHLLWRIMTLRDHDWHERDLSAKLASIRHYSGEFASPPDGEHDPSWGTAVRGLVDTGPAAMLSIFSTTKQQADWLIRENPTYLMTYPVALESLAEYWIKFDLAPLSNLLELRTFGEVVDDALRLSCRRAFDAPIVDVYSAQETGFIALQCPHHEHYHIMAEDLIVEVIDEDDKPCGPGQIGRVIVTTLNNEASPLIRYEIGDYAEVGVPCDCGRGLPVLKRILGRKRNMFVLPNGDKIWPSFEVHEGGGLEQLPIRQFQVVQRDLNNVDVFLVAARELTPEEIAFATKSLHRSLHYPFKLTVHYRDEIPRSPSGKYEDFRSDVHGQ